MPFGTGRLVCPAYEFVRQHYCWALRSGVMVGGYELEVRSLRYLPPCRHYRTLANLAEGCNDVSVLPKGGIHSQGANLHQVFDDVSPRNDNGGAYVSHEAGKKRLRRIIIKFALQPHS